MNQLSHSQLQTLAKKSSFPCISIYMPAEKLGAETRKNHLIFKKLLKEAEAKIEKLGDSAQSITDSLESAKSYIENNDFWQHQNYGLAFFISAEGIEYYRLESSFDQLVRVSDRFYLKPLFPLFNNNSRYYLLGLSQNKVRFFSGTTYSIEELGLPTSVPPSLAEALKYDDPEKQTQYHTGDAGGSPVYHGQGVGTTDNKDEIIRFFHQIDNGLQKALGAENTPLILAGVEYLLAMYREINSYPHLVEKEITGNPENVKLDDFQQQAGEIIKSLIASEKQSAMDEYLQRSATDESTDKIEEIIPAAVNGQVDTLFVAENAQKWGKFDSQANKLEIHDQANQDSVDLLDYAAGNTFLQGGKVYILQPEQMPENQMVVATLRYPVYASANK